ncbi:hypothetical protein [Streptomyces sp. NPDC005283]|uniref:hypothetical protein n=1 Tax=Streptomyces sp. NPDC005283 TaxID=3156871 RepID=UPI003454A0AD
MLHHQLALGLGRLLHQARVRGVPHVAAQLRSDSRETVFVAGDQSGVRAARDDGATDRAVLA